MQRGAPDVMVALRTAGATVPSGLAPPAVLPDAVVLRAYPPPWIWWLVVPFLALAAGALFSHAYAVVPVFVLLRSSASARFTWCSATRECAFDGPRVARRRGRNWQGPIDVRTLNAVGYTPPGTVRMPVLWVLGQREAGDWPDVYAKSAFDHDQQAAIDGLRFVPLPAARGFLSPGFERLLVHHLDPAKVILGPIAAERLSPRPK